MCNCARSKGAIHACGIEFFPFLMGDAGHAPLSRFNEPHAAARLRMCDTGVHFNSFERT